MTKLSFSTNETVSLEKSPDLNTPLVQTKSEDIDEVYEINRCIEWIRTNNFQKVCLQFPDYLLPDSSEVVLKLQNALNQTVYLLGDTAYESCCVDYIAAAHINADAIIHFGPVCFSKTSANIPFIHIYEKELLNINNLLKHFIPKFGDETKEIVVLVDSIYLYLFDEIRSAFKGYKSVILLRIDEIEDISKNCHVFFIGNNYRKLLNVALNFKPKILYFYDTEIKIFENTSKIVKRRNYIIEKIKDSDTIGIVIGTLGVKNYMKILDRVKSLISQSGKKYYMISVGKPTVAKLANFPELDIYVVITCSMSEIYESRDFYKPIATPFDIEAALNLDPGQNPDFTYDYNAFLTDSKIITSSEPTGDVSLLTNKLRLPKTNENIDETEDTSVALKSDGTIAVGSSGAGYLAQRSWRGLEQSLGQTDVHLAREGRSGIALRYENEQK